MLSHISKLILVHNKKKKRVETYTNVCTHVSANNMNEFVICF